MRYPVDWNDLRYFLAVARRGSLCAAGRELKVDTGTVSRRVAALEEALAVRCFERRPGGYLLTERGRSLLDHAERVEQEIISLDRAVDAGDDTINGVVALTAAESVAYPFVIPMLKNLRQRYPGLRIELVRTTGS